MKARLRGILLLLALPCAPALAGAPAARQGDITSHGGVIVSGSANVNIGGQPAARSGDQATCPQVTGLVPHVGGPITSGSATVFINGRGAARVGDTIMEVGPPSTPAFGAPTVLIGP